MSAYPDYLVYLLLCVSTLQLKNAYLLITFTYLQIFLKRRNPYIGSALYAVLLCKQNTSDSIKGRVLDGKAVKTHPYSIRVMYNHIFTVKCFMHIGLDTVITPVSGSDKRCVRVFLFNTAKTSVCNHFYIALVDFNCIHNNLRSL